MAITTGDFINTNRLKTSSGAPSQLNYGGTKIYRAYYGNLLIWDVWRTTLSANDFNIISKGGNVSDYTTVESYYLDALDNKNNLAYTFDPSSIGTRLETTSTTHNVKVTQTATGNSITIKATLAGAVYTTSSTVTTTQVEAKGGNSTVTVSWTLYKDGEVYKTGTSTPTSISGTDVSGDNITCTVDGVTVKVPSADKTTYSNARTVFNVMSWTFTADGKTFSGSGKVAVLQKANTYTDTWNTPILTLTPNVTSINSKETPVSLKIDSYRTGKRIYTSTAETTLHEDIGASITTTLGSLSKTSVSGKDLYSVLTIGNNTSDKSRSATVKVTAGGYTATATITQSGRTLSSTSYNTPTVKSTSIGGTIPASGGTVWLTVSWSQTQTLTYDNGTTSSSTVTGSSTATVTGGISGGGSINGGGIYAASLGTTVTAARTVYTITSYSFTANGKTGTGTGSIVVNQAENKVTNTTYGSYNLSISANSTATIPSSGDTRTIYVTCTQNYANAWASGSTESGVTNATATVSTNYGTFTSHNYATLISITGSGSATLSVVSNTGAARTVVVSAVVGNVHKEISILQNAVYYVFTQDQAEYVAGWGATTVTLTGTSTMNGSGHNILKANVSANNNASVGNPSNYNGSFSVPISLPENSSTSQKTYTVTVTQSGSGYQLMYKIYQDGKPKTNKLTWYTATATIAAATARCSFVLLFDPSIESDAVTFTIYADGESFSSFSLTLSNNYSSPIDGMYGFSFTRNIRPNNLTTDTALEIKATYGSESKTIGIDIV